MQKATYKRILIDLELKNSSLINIKEELDKKNIYIQDLENLSQQRLMLLESAKQDINLLEMRLYSILVSKSWQLTYLYRVSGKILKSTLSKFKFLIKIILRKSKSLIRKIIRKLQILFKISK